MASCHIAERDFASLYEGLGERIRSTIFLCHWWWRPTGPDNNDGILVFEVNVEAPPAKKTPKHVTSPPLTLIGREIAPRNHTRALLLRKNGFYRTAGDVLQFRPRMPIEIEKKYRLTPRQREEILTRLPEIGARRERTDFEVNTLYAGDSIDTERAVLRLRRVGQGAILTFKERLPGSSSIKHQLEDETTVGDAEAMDAILESLGFNPTLIYEKRRDRWQLGETEIVVDELPFGLFMEIEGDELAIKEIEEKLAIKRLKAEIETYPNLTRQHGTNVGGVIEARFKG